MAEGTGAGTALLMALAAVLWLMYLVPMWRRRSEYLATERNAVRLQQTLRIMAQTTELPEPVRAEMTARSVAAQQRSLAARQREEAAIARAREAAAQRALRQRLSEQAPGLVAEVDAARTGQQRLRRSRAVTSFMTLLAIIGGAVAAVVAAWAWVAFAGFVVVSGVTLLVGLARASRRRTAGGGAVRARSTQGFVDLAADTPAGRVAAARRDWTPVPLPKPLYLEHPGDAPLAPSAPAAVPAASAPQVDHAALLAAAAAEAESAQRAAAPAAQSPATPAAPSAPMAPAAVASDEPVSRFARMGLVDGLPTEAPDLDEVLQRRRAAG